MNTVIVHPNQRAGLTQHNLYTMDVDCRNQNCYNCGRFEHIAKNCRNRGAGERVGEGRRLEYGNGNNKQRLIIEGGNRQGNNNLNRERDLIVFD